MEFPHFFIKNLKSLRAFSAKRVDSHGAQYELFGIFAVINYIVPYFMWSSSASTYALQIILRLIAGGLCFLLIIKDHWRPAFVPYLPLYWHGTLLYCLPFLTTFMLLDSQGSTFWLLNMILALFLLAILVDWLSFIVILIVGILLGYLFFSFTGQDGLFFLTSETLYWAIYMCFFSVLVGILFSRRNQKIAQEKLNAYQIVSTSIAHEMRTPLSSMYISAQGLQRYLPLLLETYEIAKQNKLNIPKINNQKIQLLLDCPKNLISISRRSISIVDIFLTKFGALEKQAATVQRIAISSIIEKAIEEYPFFPRVRRKVVSFNPQNGFSINADESLMIHVFFNLLKNALYQIQKAKKGTIEIWLSQNVGFNIVHFKDTAVGIKNTNITKIFEKFYTGSTQGTGIGLAFCKKVMSALDGQIVCRSVYGKYAEFQLWFPQDLEARSVKTPFAKVPDLRII